MIKLKRAYDGAAPGDGYRVLVDRLWPRGVKKQDLRIDEWAKEIAPSTQLRRWFAHDVNRWAEFKQRYLDELKASAADERLRALAERAQAGTVTLLFSARDALHNNAVVLTGKLQKMRRPAGEGGAASKRASPGKPERQKAGAVRAKARTPRPAARRR